MVVAIGKNFPTMYRNLMDNPSYGNGDTWDCGDVFNDI